MLFQGFSTEKFTSEVIKQKIFRIGSLTPYKATVSLSVFQKFLDSQIHLSFVTSRDGASKDMTGGTADMGFLSLLTDLWEVRKNWTIVLQSAA